MTDNRLRLIEVDVDEEILERAEPIVMNASFDESYG